jgi:hypothetical protein
MKSPVPDVWKEAVVIPVLKPVTDRSQTTGYLCKTVQRMVNSRLIWVLESRNLLSGAHCRFRHHRSALDHVVNLEYRIQNAFQLSQYLVTVFFDLQKAYDKPGGTVFSEPCTAGMSAVVYHCLCVTRGPILSFWLGNIPSARCLQENGIPQGSVLSLTLFAISIKGLVNAFGPPVTTSLYVDDLAIYYSSRTIVTIARWLQGAFNRLSRWARVNGFTFSPDKAKYLHFSRLSGLHPDPCLSLEEPRSFLCTNT